MLNVGVIGLGSMGKIHLRNYCEMPECRVVGAVDVSEACRLDCGERFGVPVFCSVDELLDQKPDAVSISVPTVMHFDTAMQVIGRGVSLLVEKPLATTAEEGRALVKAAADKGVTLMVGNIERFNPAIERLRARLAEMPAGDVFSIAIERIGPYPVRIQDVGVIRDLGSHDIDLLRFLSGADFADIRGVYSASLGKHEDAAVITANMKNGVICSITTNWLTPFRSRRIRAITRAGLLEADLMAQDLKEYGAFDDKGQTYSVRQWPVPRREQMREELTRFLSAVASKTPPPVTGADGLIVLQAIEKIFAGGGALE